MAQLGRRAVAALERLAVSTAGILEACRIHWDQEMPDDGEDEDDDDDDDGN